MSDPQFGVVKILRPFKGFEAIYYPTGVPPGTVPAMTPIMLTEGGVPRDDNAGKPGYDPDLVRGLPVPLGSRIVIWFPLIHATNGVNIQALYRWFLVWRLRNTFDYRQSRVSYHYPKQGAGIPSQPGPQDRVVIPAGHHCTVINQTEVNAGGAQNAFISPHQIVTSEDFGPMQKLVTLGNGRPLMPNSPATGVFQQGVYPNNLSIDGVTTTRPTYDIIATEAQGDELLVGLYRDVNQGFPNWQFGPNEFDHEVSIALGNGAGKEFLDVGVYVTMGVSFNGPQERQQGTP